MLIMPCYAPLPRCHAAAPLYAYVFARYVAMLMPRVCWYARCRQRDAAERVWCYDARLLLLMPDFDMLTTLDAAMMLLTIDATRVDFCHADCRAMPAMPPFMPLLPLMAIFRYATMRDACLRARLPRRATRWCASFAFFRHFSFLAFITSFSFSSFLSFSSLPFIFFTALFSLHVIFIPHWHYITIFSGWWWLICHIIIIIFITINIFTLWLL